MNIIKLKRQAVGYVVVGGVESWFSCVAGRGYLPKSGGARHPEGERQPSAHHCGTPIGLLQGFHKYYGRGIEASQGSRSMSRAAMLKQTMGSDYLRSI